MHQRMRNTTGTLARTAPPTPKGQRTRTRIVEAAATLMLKQGVERTTIDAVIEAAAVGKSQLYHYFAGKDDLVEAVIAHQTEKVLSADGPHLAPLESWEAWRHWRDTVIHLQTKAKCIGGCPIGSLASELVDLDEVARMHLGHSFDRWQEAFQRGLEAMRRRGLLAEEANPRSLSVAILAMLQGGLLLCQTRKSTEPLETALDGAILLLRRYAIA